jgi:hypothetical protein
MKPFDLQKAIAGEKLVTRDGREVTEFCHFKTIRNTVYPCFAVIDGTSEEFTVDGRYQHGANGIHDLFMAPKKRTVYVQIFNKKTDSESPALKAVAFENKGDAESNLKTTAWPVFAVAVPVEIEG